MKIFHLYFVFIFSLFPYFSYSQNIDSLFKVLNKTNERGKAKVYYELSEAYRVKESIDKSLLYAKKSFEFAQKIDDKDQMASSLTSIGLSNFYLGKFDDALPPFVDAKKIYKELNNKSEMANIQRNIGVVYKMLRKYDDAVKNYQEAVTLFEQVKELEKSAQCMQNIGNVYFDLLNFEKAMKYYNDALKVFEKLNSSYYIVQVLNSIGVVYLEKKESSKALETFENALGKITDSTFIISRAKTYSNMSEAYIDLGQYQKAIQNCRRSLDIYQKQQNNIEVASAFKTLGFIYKKNKQYDLALTNLQKAILMMKTQEMTYAIKDVYKEISEVYQKKGLYDKALENYQSYSNIKDSIFTSTMQKTTDELNIKYDTDKKELQNKAQAAKLKQSKILIYSVVVVAFFILLLLFLAYNRYLIKKKANSELSVMNSEITQKNVEIEAKKDELEKQKNLVEKAKEEILSSIHYASRIQRAILPPTELFNEYLSEHFILNKPRDIVSGDFYWLFHKDNKTILAVADCTGHGVPGAFMSMLGISFLNEIASNSEATTSDQILNKLREYVMASLRQTGKENEAKDGMDISLAMIDYQNMKLQFSGAYNPLYLIKGNELTTLKGDRMPIGIYFKGQTSFTKQEVEFEKGDRIYLCSDGYEDQFGGESGRKFMSKRFQELLVSMSVNDYTMQEQKEVLDKTITDWRGERDQLDDILVVGVKL